MYKKFIAAVLAIMFTFSIAGCSSDTSAETSIDNGSQTTTAPPSSSASEQLEQYKFQEIILVDNENLMFKVTDVVNDTVWGYSLKVQIENRTDKDLMFSLNDVSVNGFMYDPFFAVTVTSGMKANKDISFGTDGFEEIGIQDVTDIQFELRVYDSNDWSSDPLIEDIFTIYPKGEDAAKEYPRENQESDIVLFDNENCTMIVTGFDPDSIWGFSVKVYLVNKTDDTLMFSVGDAAVNGFMCNPYFAVTVAPGKQCITNISWTKSALAENKITQVESLSLPIRVYDAEDWSEEDLVNETFTVTP